MKTFRIAVNHFIFGRIVSCGARVARNNFFRLIVFFVAIIFNTGELAHVIFLLLKDIRVCLWSLSVGPGRATLIFSFRKSEFKKKDK